MNNNNIKAAIDGRLSLVKFDEGLRERVAGRLSPAGFGDGLNGRAGGELRAKRMRLRPVTVFIIIALLVLGTGFAWAVANYMKVVDLATGEVSEVEMGSYPNQEVTYTELDELAFEVMMKMDNKEIAHIVIYNDEKEVLDYCTVWQNGFANWVDYTDENGVMVESSGDVFFDPSLKDMYMWEDIDEITYKQFCVSIGSSPFPQFTEDAGLIFQKGTVYAIIPIGTELRTEEYDKNTTITYYALPDFDISNQNHKFDHIGSQYHTADGAEIDVTFSEDYGNSSYGTASDDVIFTEAEIEGWDSVVCIDESNCWGPNNGFKSVVLGSESRNLTVFISVTINDSSFATMDDLLALAGKLKF